MFLPMLCETLFVCLKVILRLYPSRRAPGQRCLQIAEDICCLITANIVIIRLRVLPVQKVDFEPRIIFSPQLCETLFVCPKVILRLHPSRRAPGQRCLQIAEDICCLITANIVITRRRVLPAQGLFPNRGTRFLPTLCETFFVHIISKVILRLYPSRRAPGQRCLQIAEDICCLITANIGILHPQGHSATLIMRYPYNVR